MVWGWDEGEQMLENQGFDDDVRMWDDEAAEACGVRLSPGGEQYGSG